MSRLFLLGFAWLAACGEASIGTDEATLCVQDESGGAGSRRVRAVYYLPERSSLKPHRIEVIDDVPIDGRACLTLRPPSAAFVADIDFHSASVVHFAEALTVIGWPIDVVLYEDHNGSGQLEPAQLDAPSPDHVLDFGQALGPFWLHPLIERLSTVPGAPLAQVTALLAPGNRAFALAHANADRFAHPEGETSAWAQPWQALILLDRNGGDSCPADTWYGQCVGLAEVYAESARFVMVDPRIPRHHLLPLSDALPFDPFALPSAPKGFTNPPASSQITDPTCLRFGPYLIGSDEALAIRTDPEACACHGWYRKRTVVTLAADPVPWLVCGQVEAPLTEYEIGTFLNLEAIVADQPWWEGEP